jgi:hypothetical protein
MCLEHTLGIGLQECLTVPQPRLRLGGQRCAVKIELANPLQPSLQLLQIDVIFL